MNIVLKKSKLLSVEISATFCEVETVFNIIILKLKANATFDDNFIDALNKKFDFCDIHYVGSTVCIIPKYAGYYACVRKHDCGYIYEFGFTQVTISAEEEED